MLAERTQSSLAQKSLMCNMGGRMKAMNDSERPDTSLDVKVPQQSTGRGVSVLASTARRASRVPDEVGELLHAHANAHADAHHDRSTRHDTRHEPDQCAVCRAACAVAVERGTEWRNA